MAASGSPPRAAPVRVYALGRFQVEIGGKPPRLPARGRGKPLQLLKLLVALGGEQASVGDMLESLWPDLDGDRANRAFHSTLHRLREIIGSDVLELQGGRLSLVRDRCWVDALAFGTALREAERALTAGDVEAARAHADEALELYRGAFLPGEFDLAELIAARQSQNLGFLRLIDELGAIHLGQGAPERAIRLFQKGLEVDPTAEELYQRLMECYRRQGRLVEAVAVYQRCREIFLASVESEPSAEIQALHEAIQAELRSRSAPSAPDTRADPPQAEQVPTAPVTTAPAPAPAPAATPLAAEGERLRATVVFSDLVGYTRLNEFLDPEEVGAIVSRVKAEAVRIVMSHGGIVNQFVGDEVVALFGVRHVHEDDPCRAVRAVLELHQAVREMEPGVEARLGEPLRLHSAVNTGLMLVRARDEREGVYAINGDVVTTAARLRSLALPDEVWVGPDTAALIQPYFLTEPCETVAVRGRQAPLAPARVVGSGPLQSRFEVSKERGFTPFSGRESELATLRACLDKAMAGQGQFVTVVGEAGLGKSRLLYEFVRALNRERVIVVRGRCHPDELATPYRPFVDLLRRALRLHEGEQSALTSEQVVNNVLAIGPSLAPYLPCYLHLLSVPSEAHQLPGPLQGENLRSALTEALAALVTQALQQKPIVILLEDWHWADESSESGLKAMIDVVAQYPLMVALSYRPEYEGHWGNFGHHTHIVLAPLDFSRTEPMVQALIGADVLPQGLADRIYRHTEGNPLFIEELTRALLESGAVQVGHGQASLTQQLEELIIPDTVQAVTRSRLDRLDGEAAEVLRLASVVGIGFERRVLERIAPAAVRLGPALERLKGQELIHQIQVFPEAVFRFNHAITRMVVYDSLLVQRRSALHEQVALAMESLYADRLPEHFELLAFHFNHSADTQKALQYLERAGGKAARVFALGEARRHYRAAVERLREGGTTEELSRRIDLTLKWAAVSFYVPSRALLDALEAARADAIALKDDDRVALTTFWAGTIHYALGNPEQALARLQACRELPGAARNANVQAMSLNYLGRVCFYLVDFGNSMAHFEVGIPLLEGLGLDVEVANSLGMLAIAHAFRGEFKEAEDRSQEVFRIAERIDNPVARSVGHVSRAIAAVVKGAWAEAVQPADAARDLARRIGNSIMEGTAVWANGYATAMLGGLEEGLALMHQGIGLIESTESQLGLSAFYSRLALIEAEHGHCEESASAAERALELVGIGGDRLGEHTAYAAQALLAAQETPPRWKAAGDAMGKALRLAGERGMRPDLASLELLHARMLCQQGEPAAAGEQLNRARAAFAELGMDGRLAEADRLAADPAPACAAPRRADGRTSARKPSGKAS